ncbi:hypothetical protein SAMN02910377_01516 [Pseudobutyrivibrio ruminis]|uniref:Uncharacterized protein n=1 Tax=Pseudobutyrivibrio ruminis TaxID=46206 RepID=A0A1H7IZ44_9FIRM|nr:hypothetical protein [Pseudobutyrivibrio ruminis]SEK67242.1 hypothetical protein SAMN02910377_01516 [Pseudobutyrivibrio ruminis]
MTYQIKKILEADYGCEERPAGYVPQVLVILQDEAGNQIEREVPDADLYDKNINEGALVYFDEEGQIHKGE